MTAAVRAGAAWPGPGEAWTTTLDALSGGQVPAVAVVLLALALVVAVGGAVRQRRTAARLRRTTASPAAAPTGSSAGRDWGKVLEAVLTMTAAGIATGVSANGMWRVFGDVLGLDGPGRVLATGFLEIALVVSAIRARRSLIEHGSVGVDGAAVWTIACLSALVSAADADGLAKSIRLAAPLLAAWMWERGLAADRRQARRRRPAVIAWRWTRERLAVRLGLADPVERTTPEVDRARRLARLTQARLRLAVLESPAVTGRGAGLLAVLTLRPLRLAWAVWRLQRQALAAVEHLHLGSDTAVPATIRATVAAVVGLREATAPLALAAASPWTSAPIPSPPIGASVPRAIEAPADPIGPSIGPSIGSQSGSDRAAIGSGPATRIGADRIKPGIGSGIESAAGSAVGSAVEWCEGCGRGPAVMVWTRPQAGGEYALCGTCAPSGDRQDCGLEPGDLDPVDLGSIDLGSIDLGSIDLGSIERASEPVASTVPSPRRRKVSASKTPGRAKVSARVKAPGSASAARPQDVARLRELVEAGGLPSRPTVEGVRTALRISPAYARAAREALLQGVDAPATADGAGVAR